MTTLTATQSNQTNRLARNTAVLLLIEAFLIFVPLVILGAAIEWPASLGDPASIALPRLIENAPAVRNGYFAYLVYSILFWPVAYLTSRVINGEGPLSPILQIANGFAALSTVARTIGIIRWLFPMPILARLYVDPATSEATRVAIEITYVTLNEFAGSVGELLGVSFFAAIWLALVSIAILRSQTMPNWLGYFGFFATAALASSIVELWGVDLGGLVTVTVAMIHFWFMAAAAVFLRQRA